MKQKQNRQVSRGGWKAAPAEVHRYIHPIRTMAARPMAAERLEEVLEALQRQSEQLEEILRRLERDKLDTQ